MQRYLAWKHKRELLIQSTSATEGLQVSFTLPYYPGMRFDFRDIRIATKTGQPVPFATENIISFSSALVWFKLPANTDLLYLYYGNGQVASASDPAAVFEFWDDFLTFDTCGCWTIEHGSASVSNSVLTLENKTLNCVVQSSQKFGINTIVEARAYHCKCVANKAIIGYRDVDTEYAVAWHGATSALTNDHRFSHDGCSGTWTNDGVNRGGTTFYVYSVARLASSALYYVNYDYRGTVTTTLPSSGATLPIQFYISYDHLLKVDWVRVRKYSASMPTISIGKKYNTQPKGYPFFESVNAATSVMMYPEVSLKGFVNASTQVSMFPGVMFRQPLFYRPAITGPYQRWKTQGDIRIETQDRPVQIYVPLSPGMAGDGRDLRFSDLQGNVLKYKLVSVENGVFSCWVEVPENATEIYYYYGNGTAVSESDESITGEPSILTEYYLPEIPGPYTQWKFRGDLEIPEPPAWEMVQRVNIDLLPGMNLDGRDLRFSSTSGAMVSYKIESLESGIFTCLVEWPAGASKIYFHYGNGTAVSESSESITLDPVITTMSMPSSVAYHRWKYRGDIRISSVPVVDTQILVDIPRLPGMTLDGRDLRFSDDLGTAVKYFLESSDPDSFSVWVKCPAGSPKIHFYYGNGAAISESSAADVFNLWEDFDNLDPGVWTTVAGSPVISDSKLYLASTTVNSLLRTVATFGAGTICEIRAYHAQNNQMICGYFSLGNLRACWLGASGVSDNDYMHTHNGSTSTTTNDNVSRYGTTFYKYGVAYNSDSVGFYVDDALRGTITTTLPSGDLPISLYSEVNSGDVVVDWIRVRQQTTAVATVERHYPQSVSDVQIEEVQPTIAFVSRHYPRWQVPIKIDTPAVSAVLERHYPRWQTSIRYYDYVAPRSHVFMQPDLVKWKERKELKDYSVGAIEVSKSINDTYMQLSTEFVDLVVPPEDSTIKHVASDSQNNPHLIFHGKVVANSTVMRHNGSTVSMQAADLSRNLVVQKVPWNYQVVDSNSASLPSWTQTLLAPEETGVYAKTLIDTGKEPKQFVFNPKTTRLEAIKEIAGYAGCMIHVKLISREINGLTVTRPEFYLVPPENIDLAANGFDLPVPITLTYPDPSLVDEPTIVSEPEEKYNKVTVHGILGETGETVVASAFSAAVYTGEQKAREYLIEDNSIYEKGSTAEREAVKWLLYFITPRAKVSMQFVDRFDLELYQRIRFGPGFSRNLQALTSSVQVPVVYACDPRDTANSTHSVDVAGVPRPSWLRISEMKYHSEHALETVDVNAITDFIYSSTDPVVPEPYAQYLSPGYLKPVIDDMVQTTQTIVDDSIEKQLTPESCTVLSINEDGKTAVVQTASGKIVTVSLA